MTKTKAAVSTPELKYDLAAIRAELEQIPADERMARFLEFQRGSSDNLVRAATLFKIMEDDGVDVSSISARNLYRKIASGQLLPDFAWTIAESPARQVLERAPLKVQEQLARRPMVPVAEMLPGGGHTVRMKDITKQPADAVKVILGDEGLRSPDEQAGIMKERLNRIRVAEEYREDIPRENLTRYVTVRFTETEYNGLMVNAAENSSRKPAEFIRAVIRKHKAHEKGYDLNRK